MISSLKTLVTSISAPATRCVLLIEKDGAPRAATEFVLRTMGYQVVMAEDSTTALGRVCLADRPSLILVSVPNAAAFRRDQEALPALAGIPLLLIAEEDGAEDLAPAVGAAGVLRRPLAFRDLIAAVHRHSERRR